MNRKILLTTLGAGVILVVGLTFLVQRFSATDQVLSIAKRGDIFQEVSASGKVEPLAQVELRFKGSGKLTYLNANIGEKVSSGKLLAAQDTAQLDAQAREMQAGIDLQKAKLNQLLSGASPEDVVISETVVSTAEQSLLDAKKNIIDKLNGAYTKSDDAVRAKSDQLFDNPKTANPQLIVRSPYDMQLEIDLEESRVRIETLLNEWKENLNTTSLQSDLVFEAQTANNNTQQIKEFFEKLALVINALLPNSGLTQTTIDKWKTDISTARTNVDTAISSLISAEENLQVKESALRAAKNQLTLKTAPVRLSDIAVYQAQITQAESSLLRVETQRKDLMIYAPISSTVVSVRGEIGEIVGADTVVVSLASDDALQIQLNVVEDKIVNVRSEQNARITFDAIPGENFSGKVVFVDPTETIVGGAVYYETTILFDKIDDRIRSGMTANVWINTAIAKDVVFVPASAVQNKEGRKIVRVFYDGQVMENEVQTGIENDAGMIEIISGASEGDQVVLGVEKKKK